MQFRQKTKINDSKVFIDENLLVAREEIEFLKELVKTNSLYIAYLEQGLLDKKHELDTINQELNKALLFGVCFDEAKALAKKILTQKNSSDSLAKLLTLIYDSTVKPEELS